MHYVTWDVCYAHNREVSHLQRSEKYNRKFGTVPYGSEQFFTVIFLNDGGLRSDVLRTYVPNGPIVKL